MGVRAGIPPIASETVVYFIAARLRWNLRPCGYGANLQNKRADAFRHQDRIKNVSRKSSSTFGLFLHIWRDDGDISERCMVLHILDAEDNTLTVRETEGFTASELFLLFDVFLALKRVFMWLSHSGQNNTKKYSIDASHGVILHT